MKIFDYKVIAHLYDLIEFSPERDKEIIDFLILFFKKKNVQTVLDVSCGTGKQAIPLAKNNFQVTASDPDKGMLEQAKQKAKNLPIQFFNEDMLSIKKGCFDALISIHNSVVHLTLENFSVALKNFYSSLNDNGLLIFDVHNKDFLKNRPPGKFLYKSHTVDEIQVSRFLELKLTDSILNVKDEINIQENGKELQQYLFDWQVLAYSAKELEHYLDVSGYRLITMLAEDFSILNTENTQTSATIWVIAAKM